MSVVFKTFSLIFAKSDGNVRILIAAISYEMGVHYQGVKAIIYHKKRWSTPPEEWKEKHLTCTGVMLSSYEDINEFACT